MDKSNLLYYIAIIWLIFVVVVICLNGCSILPTHSTAQPDTSTPDQLIKIVSRTNWLATLAIIGIAASFFALLNGFRWGLAGMASCGLALFTSLATIRYAGFMAICGLIGSMLIMIGSVIIKNKALIEIITGVERAKTDSGREEYIKGVIDNHIAPVQTKHTKNIVKRIRAKINGN